MSAVVREPGSRRRASSPRSVDEAAGAVTARIGETLALVTLAVAPVFLVLSGDPERWKRGVILQAVDVLLVLLALVRATTLAQRIRAERTGLTAALTAVAAALLVSFAAHPSTTGAMTMLRLAGAIALASELAHASTQLRSRAAKLWLGWTVAEAIVAVGQKSLGRALGVPGEVGLPFEYLNGFAVPTGTSYGPHPIAALGLVGIGLAIYGTHNRLVSKRWAVAGATSGAVLVGITCGTAGAISLVLIVAAAAARALRLRANATTETKSPSVAPVLLAVVIAFGLAAATSIDGWRFKAERSATTDVAAASNGRTGMIEEAVEMIRRWPLLGVGPGRFMATRDAHPDIRALATEDQQVHNVPLLIVTESGALGAIALVALVLAVARRVRRHAFALIPLAAMSGHLMFDHAPWTFGFGMVQLALVLGFAAHIAPTPAPSEPTPPTTKEPTLTTQPLAAG